MSDNGNGYQPDFSVLKKYPVSLWEWPKVVIFVPMPQALADAPDTFSHFIEIARHGTMFMHLPYGFADRMRNEAAKELLRSDYQFILMLDADHKHPADIVHLMAARLIQNPEIKILGGVNFKRSPGYDPCVRILEDGIYKMPVDWEKGLSSEMDITGFGCTLVAREVFEAVEFPWFVNEPHLETQMLGSHDHYFCKKAQAAGIDIWCDMTYSSPHMAKHKITEQTYRTFCAMNPPEEELIDA